MNSEHLCNGLIAKANTHPASRLKARGYVSSHYCGLLNFYYYNIFQKMVKIKDFSRILLPTDFPKKNISPI